MCLIIKETRGEDSHVFVFFLGITGADRDAAVLGRRSMLWMLHVKHTTNVTERLGVRLVNVISFFFNDYITFKIPIPRKEDMRVFFTTT